MLDAKGNLLEDATKEIEDQIGLTVNKDNLVNMSKLVPKPADASAAPLDHTDDLIPIVLCQKTLTNKTMMKLEEGSKRRSFKLVPLKDVWKIASKSAETLAAITLYRELRQGKLLRSKPMNPTREPLLWSPRTAL